MHDDPRDFAVLARWLADDRVLRWYHGRDQRRSLEQIHDMYAPRVRNDDPVTPCIIELEGEPLGYLQFYPIADREKYSLADERDVFDQTVTAEFDVDRQLVAAQGIVAVRLGGRIVGRAKISRTFAMVEDDLLIELAQIVHQPKISDTSLSAAISASISARVLYMPIEARTVAGISKRAISGCAQ